MAPVSHECEREACDKLHEFCPVCDEKLAGHVHLEGGRGASDAVPADAQAVCAAWDGRDLWLHWHA